MDFRTILRDKNISISEFEDIVIPGIRRRYQCYVFSSFSDEESVIANETEFWSDLILLFENLPDHFYFMLLIENDEQYLVDVVLNVLSKESFQKSKQHWLQGYKCCIALFQRCHCLFHPHFEGMICEFANNSLSPLFDMISGLHSRDTVFINHILELLSYLSDDIDKWNIKMYTLSIKLIKFVLENATASLQTETGDFCKSVARLVGAVTETERRALLTLFGDSRDAGREKGHWTRVDLTGEGVAHQQVGYLFEVLASTTMSPRPSPFPPSPPPPSATHARVIATLLTHHCRVSLLYAFAYQIFSDGHIIPPPSSPPPPSSWRAYIETQRSAFCKGLLCTLLFDDTSLSQSEPHLEAQRLRSTFTSYLVILLVSYFDSPAVLDEIGKCVSFTRGWGWDKDRATGRHVCGDKTSGTAKVSHILETVFESKIPYWKLLHDGASLCLDVAAEVENNLNLSSPLSRAYHQVMGNLDCVFASYLHCLGGKVSIGGDSSLRQSVHKLWEKRRVVQPPPQKGLALVFESILRNVDSVENVTTTKVTTRTQDAGYVTSNYALATGKSDVEVVLIDQEPRPVSSSSSLSLHSRREALAPSSASASSSSSSLAIKAIPPAASNWLSLAASRAKASQTTAPAPVPMLVSCNIPTMQSSASSLWIGVKHQAQTNPKTFTPQSQSKPSVPRVLDEAATYRQQMQLPTKPSIPSIPISVEPTRKVASLVNKSAISNGSTQWTSAKPATGVSLRKRMMEQEAEARGGESNKFSWGIHRDEGEDEEWDSSWRDLHSDMASSSKQRKRPFRDEDDDEGHGGSFAPDRFDNLDEMGEGLVLHPRGLIAPEVHKRPHKRPKEGSNRNVSSKSSSTSVQQSAGVLDIMEKLLAAPSAVSAKTENHTHSSSTLARHVAGGYVASAGSSSSIICLDEFFETILTSIPKVSPSKRTCCCKGENGPLCEDCKCKQEACIQLQSKSAPLQPAPIRFRDFQHYSSIFQPLLKAEVCTALQQCVFETSPRASSSSANGRNRGKDQGSSMSVVRCGMTCHRSKASVGDAKSDHCPTVGLSEVRVKVLTHRQLEQYSSQAVSLSEYELCHSLTKDDLLVVVSDEEFARCRGAKKTMSGGEVVQQSSNYHLALVLSVPKESEQNGRGDMRNSGRSASTMTGSIHSAETEDNLSQASRMMQHTLLMVDGSHPAVEKNWVCLSLSSLATQMREWIALQTMARFDLVPLAPYILNGGPAVSASKLSEICRAIEVKFKEINDGVTENGGVSELSRHMALLNDMPINASVLKYTSVVKPLQDIIKNASYTSSATLGDGCLQLKAIVKRWSDQVKTDHRSTTINALSGGNVVDVDARIGGSASTLVHAPSLVPLELWDKLSGMFNSVQLYAVKYVVETTSESKDTRVALIQGPPGTGKTRTILGIISALLSVRNAKDTSDTRDAYTTQSDSKKMEPQKRGRILMCAPSNAAVDEMLVRLAAGVPNATGSVKPVQVVRLGVPPEGTDRAIYEYTLDSLSTKLLHKHESYLNLQKIKKSYDELLSRKALLRDRSVASNASKGADGKYRAVPSACEELKSLDKEIYFLKSRKILAELEVESATDCIRQRVLHCADVVVSTLSASGHSTLFDHVKQYQIAFETVIVDEAAQCTEISTLIPLRFGCKRLVLVGDPRQLPPFCGNEEAAAGGLGQSLFERLERCGHEVLMLTVQYRMHPEIRKFPSFKFYGDKLIDAHDVVERVSPIQQISLLVGDGVKESPLSGTATVTRHLRPVMFFDLRGGREEATGKSFCNLGEVQFLVSLLQGLAGLPHRPTIGVISPYKAQVALIKRTLSQGGADSAQDVEVNSVDAFQGREKDIVVLTTVRSSRIGFVADDRRLNVSITRAKHCLVIIGNRDVLDRGSATWRDMLSDLHQRKLVFHVPSSKKFEDALFGSNSRVTR